MRLRVPVVFRQLSFVLAASVLIVAPAHAEYVLAPGDRISLEVVGVPDFTTVALVDTEGQVTLPIVGALPAAGRAPAALQADIARVLGLKPIQMSAGGDEAWIQLEASRVFVSVAEYRPVFVAGDVRTGGEQAFRPGLTVRQVLARAGGIGAAIGEVSSAELAQTRAEWSLATQRLTLARAELHRLEKAFSDFQANKSGGEPVAEVWDQAADELRRLESALAELRSKPEGEDIGGQVHDGSAEEVWLAARNTLRTLRARRADLSLQRMKERLAVLEQLADVDEEALKSYEAEFTRVSGLSERGIATANALAEAERGVLAISSRALETSAETHNLRVDISQAVDRTQLEQTEEQIALLEALINENARVDEQQAQVDALGLQLSMLGAVASPGKLRTVVYRGSGQAARQLQVPMDAVVAPGDVIEFSLVSDR